MKQKSADVVIIGGGIIGCATAFYLAKRGVSVTVCEKGRIGGEQSSRNWGFVRQMGRDEAELPLMMASNRIWQNLEKELNAELDWIQGGQLAIAYNEERLAAFENWLPIGKKYGMDTKALTAREVKNLVPTIKKGFQGAFYTPSDGQAEPTKVCPAFQQAAEALGTEFISGCAVEAIDLQNGEVTSVVTEKGRIKTKTVVCAAGAWTSRFVRLLNIRLPTLWFTGSVAQTTPVREITSSGVWSQVAFRQRKDGRLYLASTIEGEHHLMLDSFRFYRDFSAGYRKNRSGVKLKVVRSFLEDLSGGFKDFKRKRILDPPPSSRAIANALNALKALCSGMENIGVERSWAGYIDCTPDMLPVIDSLTQPKGFIFATGFSGHGFGIGPIVGKLVSELIVDGKTSLDISALRFSRFKEGIKKAPSAVL
jgi:glycine/D-amino acid oxidase-like deaminating enzyme